MKTTNELTKHDDRLQMFCECCEQKVKRWDIDMVEAEEVVFEVTRILKREGEEISFNFACPECVTDLYLQPIQHQLADKFRRTNETLREQFAPTIVQ